MPGLTLTGRVVDARNQPVADATVLITGGAGSFPDLAALTDARGEFTFGGLDTPGAYEVLVVRDGRRLTASLHTDSGGPPPRIQLN